MCACNSGSARVTGPGSTRSTPPAPVQKRRWTVTYRKSGQEVVETYEGGRSQELAAARSAMINRGSVKTEIIRLSKKVSA